MPDHRIYPAAYLLPPDEFSDVDDAQIVVVPV